VFSAALYLFTRILLPATMMAVYICNLVDLVKI